MVGVNGVIGLYREKSFMKIIGWGETVEGDESQYHKS